MAEKCCSICKGPHKARGLCARHWQQWRKTAQPSEARPRAYPSLQAAFDAGAKHSTEDDCLIWDGNQAGSEPYRYGRLCYENRRLYAHIVAYRLRHGPIPDGYEVDHRCHNPLCVNVKHLRLATRKQNQEHRMGANKNSLTKIRGITYDAKRRQYRARIKHNYREIHVGRFSTIEQAEAAIIAKRNELFSHNSHDQISA